MDISEHIKLCRAIAETAHSGQTRRGGAAYINHPMRVAAQLDGVAACVAWLHDVLEDTCETVESLAAKGVIGCVVSSVVVLTKTQGTDYFDYLARVRNDGIARRVKIADMLDNLCDQPTAKQRDKYRAGILYLTL